MHTNWKKLAWFPATAAFLAISTVSPSAFAESAPASSHLVSPRAMTQAAAAASHQRQKNIDTLDRAFSSPQAQKALEDAHMNPQQVKNAVAGLGSQELAQLASRANTAQSNFAAGQMSNHDLLLIIVGIAVIVLIIVAVR